MKQKRRPAHRVCSRLRLPEFLGGRLRGFTLIELMIVVTVVGILAMIAYPAYQSQVRKARRSDGKAALQTLAAREEQFYLINKTYTTTLGTGGLGYSVAANGKFYSLESYYELTVSAASSTCAIDRCYELNAAAQTKGGQNNDTTCATLTFDSKGTKGSKNSGGTATTGCW